MTFRLPPAYSGPSACTLCALTVSAPLAPVVASVSLPLTSRLRSPALVAISPPSLTPTPCSVPTSLIAPAYMPPSALLSIASIGAVEPSAASGLADRLVASTLLRPVMTLSFFA
ncbi:hypothetical protein D3C84_653350 [compost metagenome]